MILALLADGVVGVHLAFILFVVLGGFLALRRPWVAALHLPAAVWGAWIELQGGVCPLTPLENRLRAAAGEAGYEGGFIEHYLVPILYPPGLTRTHQVLLGVGVLALNVGVYAVFVRRVAAARAESRNPSGGSAIEEDAGHMDPESEDGT